MPDIINLLPDAIANQIAAGEVVQRPASVIKELLENSIDASSTSIKLVLKDAGRNLIQVIDNGSGMSETDARMCFERHATSKIKQSADLFAIRTMGFRGEAMASIAAVAQVEMRTRLHDREIGTMIAIEDSRITLQEPCACMEGTTTSVKNLFYNVPARRNFLKSNTVEMRHILDEFQRVAMAHPEIFFSLTHNGTEIYHLPTGNLRQRIVGLLGKDYNSKIVPLSEDTDIVRFNGFIGKPESAKKTRGDQFFFVNKRFIKSAYLNHAVMNAYEELTGRDTFPLYVIFIEIDPQMIDVNVHPTKQEIKFADEKLIYNYLKVATRFALGTNSVMPALDFDADNSFIDAALRQNTSTKQNDSFFINSKLSNFSQNISTSEPNFRSKLSGTNNNEDSPFRKPELSELQRNNAKNWQDAYKGLDEFDVKIKSQNSNDNSQHNSSEFSQNSQNFTEENTRFRSKLGGSDDEESAPIQHLQQTTTKKPPYQLHQRYIISQIKSGFLILEQQAAHERILYEQYLDIFSVQNNGIQSSLFPKTIDLSPADAELLRDIIDEVNAIGFDIREFGSNSFVVQGVPTDLAQHLNEQRFVEQLLEQYKINDDLGFDIREHVARTLARQNAIKRNNELAPEAMQHLIDELFACRTPQKSPFGMACYTIFELDEIEKRFK